MNFSSLLWCEGRILTCKIKALLHPLGGQTDTLLVGPLFTGAFLSVRFWVWISGSPILPLCPLHFCSCVCLRRLLPLCLVALLCFGSWVQPLFPRGPRPSLRSPCGPVLLPRLAPRPRAGGTAGARLVLSPRWRTLTLSGVWVAVDHLCQTQTDFFSLSPTDGGGAAPVPFFVLKPGSPDSTPWPG